MTTSTDPEPGDLRRAATLGLGGALVTVVGATASLIVKSSTAISPDDWSYPFSPRAHVLLSVLWVASHVLLLAGLVGLGRSALLGKRRPATIGLRLAQSGTAVLAVGEVASMWLARSSEDSGPAIAVGTLFGLGTLLTAVGMVALGVAVLRDHRWTGAGRAAPLVFGIVNLVQIGLGPTDVFLFGVAAYGVTALWLMASVRHEAATTSQSVAPLATPAS